VGIGEKGGDDGRNEAGERWEGRKEIFALKWEGRCEIERGA